VGRGLRLAGSLVAVATLALAVAALAGGPAAWAAPLAYAGEYPGAVGRLGPIPSFLGEFPARVPALPDFAAQHPPFATVFYALVGERVAVLCWALAPVTVLYLATSAVVLGLAGLVRAATGYDVVGAVAAVDDFWSHAPGTGQRVWWVWIFGDLLAFAVILGFPLTATLAALLAAACWGHTRGEVERMWQFLVPFAVVVAARQLLRWRASLPLVAGLLLGQTLAIQVLFYTRW
jgi:hypothetical protein